MGQAVIGKLTLCYVHTHYVIAHCRITRTSCFLAYANPKSSMLFRRPPWTNSNQCLKTLTPRLLSSNILRSACVRQSTTSIAVALNAWAIFHASPQIRRLHAEWLIRKGIFAWYLACFAWRHFFNRLKFGFIEPLKIQDQFTVASAIMAIDTNSKPDETDKQKLSRITQAVLETKNSCSALNERVKQMVNAFANLY